MRVQKLAYNTQLKSSHSFSFLANQCSFHKVGQGSDDFRIGLGNIGANVHEIYTVFKEETKAYEVCSKSIRHFSLSNSVQPNHLCKAWVHTHTFMRNCEKFQANCTSHSFSVKCLLRSHNTSLPILYFQENLIVMMEQIGQRYCIKFLLKAWRYSN